MSQPSLSQPPASTPDWKAPSKDSELLIWPEPGQIIADTRANHAQLSAGKSRISGIELRELRSRQRKMLGLSDDRPVLVDGHQTELYHPGVWAKLALLGAVAGKIDADALHIAVDTDAPKHLNLRWPGGSELITDDPAMNSVPWSALAANPTPAHLDAVGARLSSAAKAWPFAPVAIEFLADLRRNLPASATISMTLTDAMHRLDESLGLRHRAIAASPIFLGQPHLIVAHHLLSRAGEFAAAYNRALTDYRKANRVRTPGRPMPDLQVAEDSCEIPFWLDDLNAPARSRGLVHRQDGVWNLKIGGDSFAFNSSADGEIAANGLKEFLDQHHARLSPRALTLTMFLRLFVADQFVHGIGGARYDRVTDQVIETFFGITPPRFSVTTSTLYFPTALGRTRACLPCLVQEEHRLRHTPAGNQKARFLEQIESLPRGSKDRQQVYQRMHASISAATMSDPRVKALDARIAQAAEQDIEDESVFDRELFYGMQPSERLISLRDLYSRRFN